MKNGRGCGDYNNYAGGSGGYMSAEFKVKPGDTYYINVGGGG